MLTQALGKLFALAEAYPDLKATQTSCSCRRSWRRPRTRSGFARQHFNDTVARYEQSRQVFPASIVAGVFNFEQREYFEIQDEAVREAPKVSF